MLWWLSFYQPVSLWDLHLALSYTHTHTRCRVCLWDKSLTALQNQPAEIRYTTTVTDNINTHSVRNRWHTQTSLPLCHGLTLSIRLSKRQVECCVFRYRRIPYACFDPPYSITLTDTYTTQQLLNILKAQWNNAYDINFPLWPLSTFYTRFKCFQGTLKMICDSTYDL